MNLNHSQEEYTARDSIKDYPVEKLLPVEIATLGGGCFWCTEACYRQMKGVFSVTSGYSGGHICNPTYDDVLSG